MTFRPGRRRKGGARPRSAGTDLPRPGRYFCRRVKKVDPDQKAHVLCGNPARVYPVHQYFAADSSHYLLLPDADLHLPELHTCAACALALGHGIPDGLDKGWGTDGYSPRLPMPPAAGRPRVPVRWGQLAEAPRPADVVKR